MTIPAGQSVHVTVRFTPNASGTASGKPGFISNAVDSPTVEQLTGTDIAPNSHQVDISWVPGDGNALGYNVYCGTFQGGPYHQINSAGCFAKLHRLYGCLRSDLLLRRNCGKRPRSRKRLFQGGAGNHSEPVTVETRQQQLIGYSGLFFPSDCSSTLEWDLAPAHLGQMPHWC
jgi:hypothetical protein